MQNETTMQTLLALSKHATQLTTDEKRMVTAGVSGEANFICSIHLNQK